MIFVDTGAFLARYIARDQYNRRAVKYWNELADSGANIFTSNFVLDEVLTLLARRTSYRFATQRARNIFASRALKILRPNLEDEIKSLEYFEKYSDQQVSYTDCISFALMKRERIHEVFSFDRHFHQAGFTVHPA